MTNNIDLYQYWQYRNIYEDGEIRAQADKMLDDGECLGTILDFCIKAKQVKRAYKLKEKLNLTPRFKNCTFETFKTDTEIQVKALAQAQNYVNSVITNENKGKNLIIKGDTHVGTGKTHLACAITNALCDGGIPALFINAIEMFNDVRSNFDDKKYKSIDVLFIDDIGKEKVTEWGCQTFYDIINTRYEQMKPTILTVESNISYLQEHYNVAYDGKIINKGNAIISRLLTDCISIVLDGADYRLKR